MSFKSGFISVIGKPNTGKSTLVNQITGQKVSIITPKPQTTRNVIRGIVTKKEYQMVFMDTPGVHKPKNQLGDYMIQSVEGSLDGVDIILYVTYPGAKKVDHESMLSYFKKTKTTCIGIMNQCDRYKEEHILKGIQVLSEVFPFNEIIPVSALTGKNVDHLMKILYQYLPEGPMYFDSDQYTDQPEKTLVAELIREKMLYSLREEIPHGVGIEIISFKERTDKPLIDIYANIYCEKKSQKRIIIGKNGEMLKNIGTKAREEIEQLLQIKVHLKLWVKVKEDWRNSSNLIKMMGYDK